MELKAFLPEAWNRFKQLLRGYMQQTDTRIAQNTANFAPAFSNVTSYAVGDYVTYNNILYRCTTAHTAGIWVAGHFTQVSVGGEFATKTSAITIDTSAFNVNSWSVLRRSGNVVTLTGRCWKEEQMTLQSGLVIGHVPEGFRPTTDTYFTAHIFEPNTTQILIFISPNGNITTLGSAAIVSRMDFYINMSWII